MCGRFTLTRPQKIAEVFHVPEVPTVPVRFNVAPTQTIPVVRQAAMGRECVLTRWGLIPSWAEESSIGNRLLNARSETAVDKPSFRSAFKHRRCLIPADGFYEWQKLDGRKKPYFIRRPDGEPFAFAGLWERWEKGDRPVESCTILTTDANGLMKPIHNRMPVILGPDSWDVWLDPKAKQTADLEALLRPCPEDWLTAYPVSAFVNNPRNDGPQCVEPITTGEP